MTLIFFPAKAEMLYFSNLKKGGQKGGQGRRYFTLSDYSKTWKFQILPFVQMKIGLPLAPLLAPLFQIWKIQYLSFRWKKKVSFFSKDFRAIAFLSPLISDQDAKILRMLEKTKVAIRKNRCKQNMLRNRSSDEQQNYDEKLILKE